MVTTMAATMAANDLAAYEARASTAKELTLFSHNILISSPERKNIPPKKALLWYNPRYSQPFQHIRYSYSTLCVFRWKDNVYYSQMKCFVTEQTRITNFHTHGLEFMSLFRNLITSRFRNPSPQEPVHCILMSLLHWISWEYDRH